MFKSIIETISTATNQGAPSSFKFHILERTELPDSIFELYTGKAKNGMMINIPGLSLDNTIFSIFIFRKSTGNSQGTFALNAMRKMVSLRHPSILRVYDTAENDNGIYISTEHVTPLVLSRSSTCQFPIYGVYQLMKGLEFMHKEAKLFHGNLDPLSIFVDNNGGFRLGGFELTRIKPDNTLVYDRRGFGHGVYKRYAASDVADYDVFGFVLVIYYLSTRSSTLPSRCKETCSLSELIQGISSALTDQKITNFLSEFSRNKMFSLNYNFIKTNPLIDIIESMETIHLRSEKESIQWLEELPNKLSKMGDYKKFQQGVFLDMILNNVISIRPLIPSVIAVITEILSGNEIPSFEALRTRGIESKMIEIIKLPDRSVRFKLLISLPRLLSIFDPKIVESVILIELLTGLTDSHPSIREQTMISLVAIADVITSNGIEKHVLPNLMKLLRDLEPSIRTNAIVSVGKVIDKLGGHDSNRRQFDIIIQCVMNGLRDPFGPARTTALKMLQGYKFKTADQGREIATKILPVLVPLLVDGDYDVATNASALCSELIDTVKRLVPPVRMLPAIAPPVNEPGKVTYPSATTGMSLGTIRQPPVVSSTTVAGRKATDAAFDSFWDDIVKPTPSAGATLKPQGGWGDNSLI